MRAHPTIPSKPSRPERVLMVVADPHVLVAQQAMLEAMDSTCQINFVLGGRAALVELDRRRVDLVVSPLHLGGVDGTEVMRYAARRRPAAVRFLLVPERDRACLPSLDGLAHRLLAAPVSPERLRREVRRVIQFQRRMRVPALVTLVGNVERLPPHPRVYFELSQALEQRVTHAEHVARIIAQDPALGARTLQLVNSGFYSLEVEITSIARAVTFLGVRAVRAMVLAAEVERAFAAARIPATVLDRVQARGAKAASLVQRLGGDLRDMDVVVTAALLHELGTLLLWSVLPEVQAQVHKRVSRGEERVAVERELHGVDHALIGAYLLVLWGVPDVIAEAVALHHAPWEAEVEGLDPVVATYLVSGAVDELCDGRSSLDMEWIQEHGHDELLARLRETEVEAADHAA